MTTGRFIFFSNKNLNTNREPQNAKAWKTFQRGWKTQNYPKLSWRDVFVMSKETQALLTNIHNCTIHINCALSGLWSLRTHPDIAFPDTLRKENTMLTSTKTQSRINTKSTEKHGKIRSQMKELFETEIVTHWIAAILKTDLYRKLEQAEQTEPSMR
jgi:hypothetical protein